MSYGVFGDDAQKAIDALKGGSSLVQDFGGTEDAATSEESSVVEQPEFSMDADYGEPDSEVAEGNEEQLEAEQPESAEEVPVNDSKDEDGQSEPDDIEYIKADGKKIKVDYSDRERIKKVHQLAAGARKWQSERDNAIKERDELQAKYEEAQSILSKADKFVEDGDDAGLYHLITGGKNLDDLVEARMEEQGRLATMSPEERDAYTNKQELERKEKALAKREEAIRMREEKAQADLDTSDRKLQQSMVNAAFNKHRFHGQFGNAKDEQKADRMLWREVISTLESYPSVTQELIDQTVAEAAEGIKSLIGLQAKKQVDKQIKKQKTEAKKEVQKEVFDESTKQKRKLQQQIRDKDYSGAIADMFSGKSFF